MKSYLEMLPLNNIAKYNGMQNKNVLPFSGYPRQHPSEKNKLLLVNDPLGEKPTILEFKLDDVLFMEEIPSVITEDGEGIPMIRLWIRRGAHGVVHEPFEVDSPLNFAAISKDIQSRFKMFNEDKNMNKSKYSSSL